MSERLPTSKKPWDNSKKTLNANPGGLRFSPTRACLCRGPSRCVWLGGFVADFCCVHGCPCARGCPGPKCPGGAQGCPGAGVPGCL
eukprot:2948338-Pyramimonas_sp.AAC.1